MKELKAFVIPQEGRSIIASIADDKIIETGKMDIPYTSKSVVTGSGLIASLCFGKKTKSNRLRIFDASGRQLVRKTEYKHSSIACKNDVLYLGGQFRSRRGELFACIDLSNVDFTAAEVALPVQSVEGKSIDDILIRNNRLILVDNIIYPKYLFEYDITTPDAPKHIATEKLSVNGTYEHIIKGDINDDYMVLFSASVGASGMYKYITISGKRKVILSYYLGGGLRKRSNALAEFLGEEPHDYKNDIDMKNERNIFDIALIDDCLFILRSDGLEYLDLSQKITKNVALPIKCGIKGEKLIKTPNNRLLAINKNEYELITLSTAGNGREA